MLGPDERSVEKVGRRVTDWGDGDCDRVCQGGRSGAGVEEGFVCCRRRFLGYRWVEAVEVSENSVLEDVG